MHQPADGPGAHDVPGAPLPARGRAARATTRPAAADPDPHRGPPAAGCCASPRGTPTSGTRSRRSRGPRRTASRPTIAERIAALDDACRAIGRDPAEIRRSTWATSAALRSPEAYLDFVRRHYRLGFTDFSTVRPRPATTGSCGRSRGTSSPSCGPGGCSTEHSGQTEDRPFVTAGRGGGGRGATSRTWSACGGSGCRRAPWSGCPSGR